MGRQGPVSVYGGVGVSAYEGVGVSAYEYVSVYGDVIISVNGCVSVSVSVSVYRDVWGRGTHGTSNYKTSGGPSSYCIYACRAKTLNSDHHVGIPLASCNFCHLVLGLIFYSIHHVGKTLLAKAVANQTSATFLRVVGSELIQKYLGDGPKVRC